MRVLCVEHCCEMLPIKDSPDWICTKADHRIGAEQAKEQRFETAFMGSVTSGAAMRMGLKPPRWPDFGDYLTWPRHLE